VSRSSFLRAHVVLVIATGCSSSTAGLQADHAAAIRDSVSQALEAFGRHAAAQQWDSMTAHYATDPEFRWIENGEVRYRSGAEIRQALTEVPPTTRIVTTYEDTEIHAIAPGTAVVNTGFRTEFVDSTTGNFGFGGAITMMFLHRPEGWRIIAGHTSAPIPRRP
jgi:hypothetical protein